jgi:hypothetical protein
MKNNHDPRGQLDVFAPSLFWEQMQLLGKGLRPLAHCAPLLLGSRAIADYVINYLL